MVRNLLLKDISLKIFALLISLVIWLFAAIDRSYVLTRRLPIRFKGLTEGKVISYQSTDFVDLTLEGKGRDFLLLRGKDLFYEVLIKEVKNRRERFKFTTEGLKLREGIRVLGFKPEVLDFEIDDLIERRMTIKIPQGGGMEQGFFLTDCEVLDTVFLFGPMGEMPFVDFLYTESLSLKGIKKSQEKELRVIPPSKRGFFVRPEKVRVRLQVEPETTVTIEGISVKTDSISEARRKSTPLGINFTPKKAKVTVSGPPSLISRISEEEIKVILPVDKLKSGRHLLPARILLPPGIIFKKCEPDRFQVEIK